jgi:hypothetical protein
MPPDARDALLSALASTAQAFRTLDATLPVDTLRAWRLFQAVHPPAGLVLTVRQVEPGAAAWLELQATDARGRRLPLLRLPTVADEGEA